MLIEILSLSLWNASYVKFDFDLAQQKLAECEKVTLHSCFTHINYDSLLYLHVGTGKY